MRKLIIAALTLTMPFMLGACGSNSSDNSGATVTAAVATCSTGYVYSSTYGCLAQSTCPSGYGMYNGTCVVATSTAAMSCATGYVYSSTYGCLPQSTCSSGYALYNGTCIYVGTTTTSTTTATCQGSCAAGYVQTYYGCMPQSTCQACFGYYNHYCMGAASTGYMWYQWY